METVFYNLDPNGRQTFQIRKDSQRQLIFIRPFERRDTTVVGVSDEFVFDPSALRAHPDHGRFWTDHMCWAIENRGNPAIPDYCRALYPFCPPGAPDPDMRATVPRWLTIFVPFADSPVEDMMVMCYVGAGLGLIDTPAKVSDRRVIERELMPGFDIHLPETCAPGAVVRGRLRLRASRPPAKTTAYLESDAGYLPRREIEVVDGEAEFAFMALGLGAGERARVDAGFRHFRAKDGARVTIAEGPDVR